MNKKEIGLWVLIGTFFLAIGGNAMAQAPANVKYQEGIHYTVIENAPKTGGNTVEVVEAFSYLCSHCATFEPYISSWVQRKPENVSFRRIPVVFGRGSWEVYAQAYVTAELMGIADRAHGPLMDKLWKEKAVMRSVDDLSQFYAAFGTDPEKFVATSKSFAVDAQMRKEQRDVQTAGVRGTPSLIVNGKYLVSSSEAVGSYDVMLGVVDYLVALELASQNMATAEKDSAVDEKADESMKATSESE